jgi:hypothetical protein
MFMNKINLFKSKTVSKESHLYFANSTYNHQIIGQNMNQTEYPMQIKYEKG